MVTMQEEVWKDVVGYEEYFKVSNMGRVFTKRSNKIPKFHKSNNYWIFCTRFGGRKSKAFTFRVHRLVAEAFLPPPSDYLKEECAKTVYGKVIVRHIDNNTDNNKADNLLWGTYQDNTNDWLTSTEHLLTGSRVDERTGCNHTKSKLTEEDVNFIREFYKPKCKVNGCRALAKKYDVSHAIISSVVLRKTYRNIP